MGLKYNFEEYHTILKFYFGQIKATFTPASNSYVYELRDHLGSVRVAIGQNKTSTGQADVVTYSDYYPFGSPLTFANNDYRYGYQGQYAERDKETGWNNFELRAYDPLIGRWLSTDLYGQYYSPYVGMGNNPVSMVDPDGGYSKSGSWWRNAFDGGNGISEGSNGVWGYDKGFTTSDGGVGVTYFTGGKNAGNNWDNNTFRSIVPDFYSRGLSYSLFMGPGYTGSINATWVTRGKESSFFPLITYSAGAGAGSSASFDITESKAWYTGNPNEITRDMVYNSSGINGLTYSVNGGFKAVLDISVEGNITKVGKHSIVGVSSSLGLAIPTIPTPIGGSASATKTGIIYDFYHH